MRRLLPLLALGLGALTLCGPASAQSLPAPPAASAPVSNFEYDANGNPTKVVLAPGAAGFGFPTSSSYDRLSRRKDSTDASSGVTRWDYNGRTDVTQITDPRNLATIYSRNGLGDVKTLTSPDTGAADASYDAAGNLKTRTDSRGVLATYSYDALNRLTGVVYSKAGQTSESLSWTYDQTGAGFSHGIGRLTSSTHPEGSSQYAYDALGRLTTFTQVVNAKVGANLVARTHVVSYEYDDAGRITGIVYPSGRKAGIVYTAGLPSSVTLANSATATPTALLTGIVYEPFGPARSWNWTLSGGGSRSHERVFDASARMVRYPLGSHVRDIGYDAADRITGYTHYDAATGAAVPSLDQGFGYDELGRLTSITTASTNWSIGYDANGNRTSVTQSGSTRTYTTAATSNRLLSLSNPTRSLGYDNAGNTTSDSVYTATYSLAGRLRTLTASGATSTYTVTGDGQRVRKYSSTSGTSTVIFVYDQAGRLLGEYDRSGDPIREYLWLDDIPVVVFTPGAIASQTNAFYIHTDHLGAPRIVLDRSNNLRWRWLAEPFGTGAAEENPAGQGAFAMPLRLPGQVYDAEAGLHYNFLRDYDPSVGRYVQSDPVGLASGINTYAYVRDNPVSLRDPTGLDVTVCYYPDGATHVGFGPTGAWEGTSGFYPQRAYRRRTVIGITVPGEVRSDPPDAGMQCVQVPALPTQDSCMQSCKNERQSNPGNYNLYSRQCTSFVKDCLQKCQLPYGDPANGGISPAPYFWFRSLAGQIPAAPPP